MIPKYALPRLNAKKRFKLAENRTDPAKIALSKRLWWQHFQLGKYFKIANLEIRSGQFLTTPYNYTIYIYLIMFTNIFIRSCKMDRQIYGNSIQSRALFALADSHVLKKSLSKIDVNVKYDNYILGAVVSTFFICWAPFHTQRLLYVYGQDADYYPDMNEWLYIFSGCFYYSSTAVNPLLYNFMSSRYRAAYKEVLNISNPCISNKNIK